MATIKFPTVKKVIAKGRTYFYAWVGGPRIKADPADEEAFAAEIAKHLATRKGGDPRTIAGLVIDWKKADAWTLPADRGGLADSTKSSWRPWLDRISDHFGTLSVKVFGEPEIRQDIKRWRNKWKATPRKADMAKQVLSALLSYAVEEGRLSSNPCFGISNLYSNDRSEIIWTADDLASFAETASPVIMFSLRLACLTGIRQADLLRRLTPRHVSELEIHLPSGKSRGQLSYVVPMYAELRELLAEIDAYWETRRTEILAEAARKGKPTPLIRRTTVLFNSDLQPWASGFSSSWNKACWAALPAPAREQAKEKGLGLEEAGWTLHFHDARGTAATKFALVGFAPDEIAEILAWTVEKVERILKRYVNREALLRAKIRRIDEDRRARDGSPTENSAGTEAGKLAGKLVPDGPVDKSENHN